jgi:hypothetical protein
MVGDKNHFIIVLEKVMMTCIEERDYTTAQGSVDQKQVCSTLS